MSNAILSEKGKSKGELEALEITEDARETAWSEPSFVADLFMGRLSWDAWFPYPDQSPEDRKIGDEYLAKLDHFLKDKLDGDLVDREGVVPPEVMQGLAELGAFGMKIPKEFGGLGLSQVNYNRALALICTYCSSTAAMLSAHQSIGVPQPLRIFGTEEQKKKYLPMLAAGKVSAFALTEPGVGSDPAQMLTVAEPTPDGNHYIINGLKLWCTNGGIADVLVVMARTPSIMVKGREKKQITAFIVEKTMPGFEIEHRCRFMGLNGVQNVLIRFKDVKVPKENIIWGTGKGLRLALTTLNAGRLSLPATCIGGGRACLELSRKWGAERSQWGAPVGKHEAGAEKLASTAADLFAMEAVTWASGAWVDRKTRDIRLEAAMAKVFCSLRAHELIDRTIQFRGGRGYERASSLKARGETPWPVERMYRDSRINQIVEGTTEILRLFIAREALDRHLKVAGAVLSSRLPIHERLTGLVRAGAYYVFWYPRLWLGCLDSLRFWGYGRLGRHMRYATRTSKRLARATFHQMLRHGPALEKRQLQLMRLVAIATDLFAMSATIGRAHGHPESLDVADLFCRQARERIEREFRLVCCNSDGLARKLGKSILAGERVAMERHY